MNAFATAVRNTPTAFTENGAATFPSAGNPVVDLFFNIGSASKGVTDRVNVLNLYDNAKSTDYERAVRTMLWMRDIREGAGRRQAFRDWLVHLENTDPKTLSLVLPYVSHFGRWDDLLVLKSEFGRDHAFQLIRAALNNSDGLCAKWMPRKGEDAVALRTFLGLTPKGYRKLLVSLTSVVETPMCAKMWNNINYSHVPSVAAARYKKAFFKNDAERYAAYVAELQKPEDQRDPKVKVNAGAVYPFDVIKGIQGYGYTANDLGLATAQWNALPNYVGDAKILPLVDVSGSMMTAVQGNVTAMDVSVSLGIYLAQKNTGAYKNLVLSFTDISRFFELQGDLRQMVSQVKSHMGYNTNIQTAFDEILRVAKLHNVPQEELPEFLLVISDMEFDSVDRGQTNFQAAQAKFAAAGYKLPNVIWWNVNARTGNSPVRIGTAGTALISGFSPAIMKSVLSATEVTPLAIVDATIMKDRYNIFSTESRGASWE